MGSVFRFGFWTNERWPSEMSLEVCSGVVWFKAKKSDGKRRNEQRERAEAGLSG